VHYTHKDGALYAWFVSWPAGGKVRLPQAAAFKPVTIQPVGGDGSLKFATEDDAVVVELPDKTFGKYVWGLKLTQDDWG
jgi:hypothetical protein